MSAITRYSMSLHNPFVDLTTNKYGKRTTYSQRINSTKLAHYGEDSEIVKVRSAVVKLAIGHGLLKRYGSGVVISSDGLIATAKHVVESRFSDDPKEVYRAYLPLPSTNPSLQQFPVRTDDDGNPFAMVPLELIHKFPDSDLAILKAPSLKDPYTFLPITDSTPEKYSIAYTLGYPSTIEEITLGEILSGPLKLDSSVEKDSIASILANFSLSLRGIKSLFEAHKLESKATAKMFYGSKILSSNQTNSGDSGGALLNEASEATGIVSVSTKKDLSALKRRRELLQLASKHFPIKNITGSVPTQNIVEWLEKEKNVPFHRIRDGKPAGIS